MNKIFVKSVNWVGDAVMVTPFLRVLRRLFPEAHITLLAPPAVAEVFEANPDIDRLWTADERGSIRRFREIAARMRKERFDLGVALPNSFASALLLTAGRVRRRVGYNRDGRGLLLTDRVAATDKIRGVHEVEYYINLLRGFGDVDAHERRLVLEPAPGTDRAIERALLDNGLSESELSETPLIGLCPGAAFGTAKRWLPERFAEVADRAAERWGARAVIVGAPSERRDAEEIARVARHPVVALSGKIPLRVSIALFDRLRAFVTNDCGSMHLAAGRDTPIVAVFGPTKSENTAPFHPRAIIVRARELDCDDNPCMRRHCPNEHNCMKSVSVEEVSDALDRQMEIAS